MSGFRVCAKLCETCIYRKRSPDGRELGWNLEDLENQVRDKHIGFKGHRICHTLGTRRKPVCCRGFWNRHKDEFPAGQIAQRLGMVEFVK